MILLVITITSIKTFHVYIILLLRGTTLVLYVPLTCSLQYLPFVHSELSVGQKCGACMTHATEVFITLVQ